MAEAGRNGGAVKIGCFAAICVLSVILMTARPFDGLSGLGHCVMGSTLMMVGGWIFRPWDIPCSVSGLFFLGAMLILGMPPAAVFSGFSQNALWTLIPALFFGFALQKTGLGQRIALYLLKAFPSNWAAVICAWVIIGLALSLVTPSMTVRAAIMIPIAAQCCRLYELPKGSKSAAFLQITALMMAIVPGNGWLTGTLTGPIIQGIFDSTRGLEGVITFDSWLKASLLPVLVTTVVLAVLGFFFLRPEVKLSRDTFLAGAERRTRASRHELETAVILGICCVLFFTGNIHHIPNTAICLFAVVLLFVLGVAEPEEFSTAVSWDLIVFIGTGLCMSGIFTEAGLSDWLSDAIAPALTALTERPVIFVFLILTLLFLWRFVDVTTLIPTTVVLAPIVQRVSVQAGISPMVWTTLFSLAICSVFLSYTNMWAAMGRRLVGDYAWTESQVFRYGLAYFAACCAGVACAIPLWTAQGLL